MVVFDSATLLLLLDDKLPGPQDPKTGKTVENAAQRVLHFVSQMQQQGEKIIIPTPVLSEVLVHAEMAGADYVNKLTKSKHFEIRHFDTLAAIELALLTASAKKVGDKKSGSKESWAKVKFDRQIVAIASVCGASAIYSNDGNLKKFANSKGIKVIGIEEMELPVHEAQYAMALVIKGRQLETQEESAEQE